MLALAQALIVKPKVVLMDEPTEGVAPVVVEQLIPAIGAATDESAVVLVEQNIDTALALGRQRLRSRAGIDRRFRERPRPPRPRRPRAKAGALILGFLPVDSFNVIVLAAVFVLVATGLHFTFGMLNVVNLVHGELILIGAYTALQVQKATGNVLLGMALAPVVAGTRRGRDGTGSAALPLRPAARLAAGHVRSVGHHPPGRPVHLLPQPADGAQPDRRIVPPRRIQHPLVEAAHRSGHRGVASLGSSSS